MHHLIIQSVSTESLIWFGWCRRARAVAPSDEASLSSIPPSASIVRVILLESGIKDLAFLVGLNWLLGLVVINSRFMTHVDGAAAAVMALSALVTLLPSLLTVPALSPPSRKQDFAGERVSVGRYVVVYGGCGSILLLAT